MTDAHCHVSCGDPSVREFLIGRDFIGVHPWESLEGLEGLESLEGLEGLDCLHHLTPAFGPMKHNRATKFQR